MHPLYLFAPENDMALAFGGKYYTPTPIAQTIARDLSLLPVWYATEADAQVLSVQTIDNEMQQYLDALGITARVTASPSHHTTRCVPWGWSAYIVDKLQRAGINGNILPDDKQISLLRQLSSRATTCTIIEALSNHSAGYTLPPTPHILRNDNEVKQYIESYPATILKAPWSSSGRGVWAVSNGYDTSTQRYASGIIRKQGYIMGEVLQEKIIDLAMEFESNGKEVKFAGYSLFTTDSRGAYQGNLLASNEYIEQQLSQYIDTTHLHNTRRAMEHITSTLIAPHYQGHFGIDMILYRNSKNNILLHPCIELNLRMSMGMVARTIADRFLSPASIGTYHVDYHPDSTQIIKQHHTLQHAHPLHINNHRITSGYLPLTPIHNNTHYTAYIVVEEK